MFLRGTFEQDRAYPDLHCDCQTLQNYANTFTEKGYTAAHKEMDESLNRDLFEQIVRDIGDSRKKTEPEVRALIYEGPFLPEDAPHAVSGRREYARIKWRTIQARKLIISPSRHGDDYARVSPSSLGLDRGPRIAVIYAAGAITGGHNGYDPINGPSLGSDTLIDYIKKARSDSSVRAIVLRIDSPGGSSVASDAIWRELMITKRERADRPLIALSAGTRRVGRYYIAIPARYRRAAGLTAGLARSASSAEKS